MKISWFRLPAYKKFNYQPLYYDPEKEQREEREAQIKSELGLNDSDEMPKTFNIKGKMRQYSKARRKEKITSNLRILAIVAILTAITYWLLLK